MIKRVTRNLKFFIPLLLKYNPFSIIIILLPAIFQALSSLMWIIFPAMIVEELMNAKRINVLITIVLTFVLITSLISLLSYLSNYLNRINSTKADFYIQGLFNQKVMNVDYYNIEDPTFLDLMNRAKKAMNEYTGGIYSFIWHLRTFLTGVLTVSGIIGIIIYSKEYLVVAISMLGVFLSCILSIKYQDTQRKFDQSFSRNDRRMLYFNRIIANFRNQKELRLYNGKELILDAATKENKIGEIQYNKFLRKLKIIRFFDSFFTLFITNFFTLAVLGYSFFFNDEKTMTVATLTMLYNAITNLDESMFSIIYSAREFYNDCLYQEDFIKFMETKSIFNKGNLPIDHINKIEFRNVSFKYPRTDKYILKDVNFTIQGKEKILLVGLNGSGKTTIIKLLCRFYDVSEGEILVNDVNINEYDKESYLKLLAVVFQDYKIISYTIKSNIAILDENKEKLYNVLDRSGALDFVLKLPNKENTYVNKWFDKRGVEFSGGEMQKFAIARSLYKDSDLVVLDEPTSALDPIAEAQLYYNYKDIIGEKLSIFISHRLSSCIFSDRILVIDNGMIIEEGNHKELMKNKEGLYYKMFTAQAEYYKKN